MDSPDSHCESESSNHGRSLDSNNHIIKKNNIVTNLLRSLTPGEGDLIKPISDQEFESDNEVISDDNTVFICYEPVYEESLDEEGLQNIAFLMLNNFVESNESFSKHFERAALALQKPKVFKTYVRKCRICQRAFSNQKDLDYHKELHFEFERSFKCKYCNKLFFDLRNLKAHQKNHVRENTKCKLCSKEFRLEKYLQQHVSLQHSSNASFEKNKEEALIGCDRCIELENCECEGLSISKSKSNQNQIQPELKKDSMKMKGRNIISRGMKFFCDECGTNFRSKAKFDEHSVLHLGFKPYKCSKCGKSYFTSKELEKHSANHKKEIIRLYKCERCIEHFFYLGKITEHMQEKHPNYLPYKCKECELEFPRSESLEVHEKSHVVFSEPPSCEFCGKKFRKKFSLKRHIEMFHEEVKDKTP